MIGRLGVISEIFLVIKSLTSKSPLLTGVLSDLIFLIRPFSLSWRDKFPANKKEWGIGQVQSIIKEKVTVNFENVGKKVINAKNVELIKLGK